MVAMRPILRFTSGELLPGKDATAASWAYRDACIVLLLPQARTPSLPSTEHGRRRAMPCGTQPLGTVYFALAS